MLEFEDIKRAQERLQSIIHNTDLELSTTFSDLIGAKVYLKMENLQKTGSFKIRGAYNKIACLSKEEKAKGVIAASAGNHAQGVAYAAHQAGIISTIVMPETAPISKVLATRGYGAEVVLHSNLYDEAYQKAREIQKSTGATFIHAFDDLEVIAGQGTIGLEILDALGDVEVVLVPIGGGGLASGVAVAIKSLKPKIKVIGVEAQGAACMKVSREAQKICTLEKARTIADGIAVKCPGSLTYSLLEKYLDDVVTVDDEEIASTILLLLERAKLVVEGAGAVSLAAALYQKVELSKKKVAAIISGGNIDVNFVSRIIERGLVKNGRHIRIYTTMSDRPGTLQAFLQIIAQERGNVIAINHDRNNIHLHLDEAQIEAMIETQSLEHGKKIIGALERRGFKVQGQLGQGG
jgi:threonine dehydratase